MWDYYGHMVTKLQIHCCHIYSIKNMRAASFLSIIYVQGIVSDISCKADITSFRSLPELVNTSRNTQV
jgi:hypothetical protein